MTYSALRRGPGGRPTAQSYSNIGLETQVLSATPEELITLLLDGARVAVIKAKIHLDNDQIAERGQAISKAIDIVDTGLKSTLDQEKGGEVAAQLLQTYDLILYHLMQANLHSDKARLDIAESMLTSLLDTWREATKK